MPKGPNLDDPEPQTMAVIQYEWWFEYSGRGLVIGKEGWCAFYTHSDSRNVPVAGSVVCSLVRGRPALPWQFDRGTLHVPRQCGKVQNQMGVVFGGGHPQMGLPFGFPLNHQQRPPKKTHVWVNFFRLAPGVKSTPIPFKSPRKPSILMAPGPSGPFCC